MATMSSSLAATMRQTAQAFLHAYETWTTEAVMAIRAPECQQVILPASLGVPTRDNQSYAKYFDTVQGRLRGNKVRRPSFLPLLVLIFGS